MNVNIKITVYTWGSNYGSKISFFHLLRWVEKYLNHWTVEIFNQNEENYNKHDLKFFNNYNSVIVTQNIGFIFFIYQ